MKQLIAGALAMGMSVLAQAQLVAPGTRATLVVDYEYSAVGGKPDRYDPKDWKVSRKLGITVQLVADKQQALPSMHRQDAAQQADMKSEQDKAISAGRTMMPTANDMMGIATRCGEDEACITREVQKYGAGMQITPEMKQARDDIQAISKESPPRYQAWKVVAQSGTFAVDETHNAQITDAGEGTSLVFTRNETLRGNGALPPPARGRSIANNLQLEVDSVTRNMILALPLPISVPMVSRVLKSTVPGDSSGTTQVPISNVIGEFPQQTAAIAGGLNNVTGMASFKARGAESEGGTFTVRWRLSVP